MQFIVHLLRRVSHFIKSFGHLCSCFGGFSCTFLSRGGGEESSILFLSPPLKGALFTGPSSHDFPTCSYPTAWLAAWELVLPILTLLLTLSSGAPVPASLLPGTLMPCPPQDQLGWPYHWNTDKQDADIFFPIPSKGSLGHDGPSPQQPGSGNNPRLPLAKEQL